MKFIPQMEPWFGEEERLAINEYMLAGGWITEFAKTAEFESLIARYTGARHCLVVNNGTISLTMAAMSLGIGHGDEVIVPNYTMIATPNSIKILGAVPVFVDVEIETLCLDFDLLQQALSPKTKAIMLVTANGRFPKTDIIRFQEFCQDHNLFLIEDSAQSLGSFYPDGVHIGRKGIIGSFSFSAPKIISTGQGGALITDSDEVFSILKKLKDFGRTSGGNDFHDVIGYNFKFTELQACIGIEQMKKLEWRISRKKQIYTRYKEKLDSIDRITFFEQDLDFTTPWFIDILAEKRDQLQCYLKDHGIGSRVMYPPINKQIAYSVAGYLPVSERVGADGIWLPSSSQLTDDEIDFIAQKIREFYS